MHQRARSQTSGSEASQLLAFADEGDAAPSRVATVSGSLSWVWSRSRVPIAIAGLVAATAVGSFAANRMLLVRAFPITAAPGKLSVETRPPGVTVIVDGVSRGVTPLALSLEPGNHTMTVRGDRDERSIDLSVTPGADIARYFELKPSTPVETGGLSIVTDPPGLQVRVDGRPTGRSPLTVPNLAAGNHEVSVAKDSMSAARTVRVASGTVASVVFSLTKGVAPAAGWLAVKAPFDVQILEGSDVIGTGEMAKVMLPAGKHDIIMMNRALDYRETRQIVVAGGTVTSVRVDAPEGTLNVNAQPWADVTLGGRSIGQTPLANLAVPIGTHDIVFRHPQLGERRQRITVSVNGPNRISVDLTK